MASKVLKANNKATALKKKAVKSNPAADQKVLDDIAEAKMMEEREAHTGHLPNFDFDWSKVKKSNRENKDKNVIMFTVYDKVSRRDILMLEHLGHISSKVEKALIDADIIE